MNKMLNPLAIAALSIAMLAPAKAGEFIPEATVVAAMKNKWDGSYHSNLLKSAWIGRYILDCAPITKAEWSNAEKTAAQWADEIIRRKDRDPAVLEAVRVAGDWYRTGRSGQFCRETK